jgi:hypothetical protein
MSQNIVRMASPTSPMSTTAATAMNRKVIILFRIYVPSGGGVPADRKKIRGYASGAGFFGVLMS